MKHLRITDPEIARAILLETRRQGEKLELIASENFASEAVFEAQNSVLMNKYAEGYPGRRYYGGCEHVDIAERLAIERAKLLFDADHANVQPHSGTQANMQAYFSLLEPGDTILGLNLAHGGHLSHGHPVNFSGRYFKTAFYGVERETGTIDYDQLRAAALAARPKLIVAGASAYPRILDFARFAAVAEEVGALLHGRHRPHRRARGRGPAPLPGPARGGRDQHHAQDPARAARRAHPLPRGLRQGDRQERLPGLPGRPADARHRRQGGGLPRGAPAGVQGVPGAGPRQRPGARRRAVRARPAARLGRHRQPPDARRPRAPSASPAGRPRPGSTRRGSP